MQQAGLGSRYYRIVNNLAGVLKGRGLTYPAGDIDYVGYWYLNA